MRSVDLEFDSSGKNKAILVIAWLLCAEIALAKPLSEVSEKMSQLLAASQVKKKEISATVVLMDAGKKVKLWSLNEKTLRVPASVTKILTAGAVLDQFSTTHQFVTRLFVKPQDKKGAILSGDLYLKGGGDPSFVSEKMWFLVNELRRSGIKKVQGDLVVDDTLFDRDLYPGRRQGRVDRAYDAPISAMSFNWNSVNVFVRASSKNQSVNVTIDPPNDYIELKNLAKTTTKNRLSVSRKRLKNHDVITVSGTKKVNSEESVSYKSISYPSLWTGYNLKTFLQQQGIDVAGKIKVGKVPPEAEEVAVSKSKPLSLIVADLMKFSNNYVAEMLTKQLSLETAAVGNLEGGMKKIRQFFSSIVGEKSNFRLENSSGLTTLNKMTTEQITQVLVELLGRFDLSAEFVNSLPIAGVDGTLKNRMRGTRAEEWVRAKTGLLSGVAGLAGYAGRRDGVVVSFAFIYNGKHGDEWKAKQLFDRWAIELAR